MTKQSWDYLRTELEREVFRRSVREVAEDIPADRTTIYRLVNGDTKHPTRAVRAGVERLVHERDNPAER